MNFVAYLTVNSDLSHNRTRVWSRGVTRWFRSNLSVADSFVCRCLTS